MSILSRDRLISLRRPQTLSGFCAASLAALAVFSVASVAALGVTLPAKRPASAPPTSATDATVKLVAVASAAADEAIPQAPPRTLEKPKLDGTAIAAADATDVATAQPASRPAHAHATHHHARAAARVIPVRAELGVRAARPARHPAHTAGHLVPVSRVAPPEAVAPMRVHAVYAAAPPS
jgi:hypothetical protein